MIVSRLASRFTKKRSTKSPPAVGRPALAALCLVAALASTPCWGFGTTKIGEVLKDPRGYDGRIVRIQGHVTGSLNVMVIKSFSVRDDSGEIMVITDRSVPAPGQKVKVKGRVNQAFAFAGKSLVVVVEEKPG